MSDIVQESPSTDNSSSVSTFPPAPLKPNHKNNRAAQIISLILTAIISCSIGAGIVGYYAQQEFEKQWLGGYGTGRDIGYQDGYNTGHDAGYDEGYSKGYIVGFDESSDISYDQGYDEGFDRGYDDGHDDGYDKGYSDALETTSSSTSSYSSSSSSGTSSSSSIVVSGSGSFISPSTDQSFTVYVTDTGEKYHRAGCSYLKKSSNPMSLSSAKAAGYTPCSRCNPPS